MVKWLHNREMKAERWSYHVTVSGALIQMVKGMALKMNSKIIKYK
jgi:hypothetical protein